MSSNIKEFSESPLSNFQEQDWKQLFTRDIYDIVEGCSHEEEDVKISYTVANAEEFNKIRRVTDLSQDSIESEFKVNIVVEDKNADSEIKSIPYDNVTISTVPHYTSSGFYIDGVPYGARSESTLAPGWYMHFSPLAGWWELLHRSKYGENIIIIYKHGKFSVRMRTNSMSKVDEVPLWHWLKALSGSESFSDILNRLNRLDVFITDFIRVQKDIANKLIDGATYSEPSNEKCAEIVVKSFNKYISPDIDFVNYLQALVFSTNRLKFDTGRKIRFNKICGFNAAVNERLARDLYLKNGKVIKKGVTLTAEDISSIQDSEIPEIYVDHNSKQYKLFEVSIEDNPTFNEIIAAVYYFGLLISGIGTGTNKDDFCNKSIKTVSTLVAEHIEKQLDRLTSSMLNNYTRNAHSSLTKMLLNNCIKSINKNSLKESIRDNPAYNMQDDTNSIVMLQQSYKMTAPKSLGKEARSVKPSHFNRVCSFTTPESKPVGLNLSLSLGSKVVDGYVSYPVYKVVNGVRVSQDEVFINDTDETNKIVAPYEADLDTPSSQSNEEMIPNCRLNGEIISAIRKDISFQTKSSIQSLSPILLFVPSLNRNAGKRLTMAANAISQARQPIRRNRPWLTTGVEAVLQVNYKTARDILESTLSDFGMPLSLIKPDTRITLAGVNSEFKDTKDEMVSYGTELIFNSTIKELDRFTYVISRLQPASSNNSIRHQRVRFTKNNSYALNDTVITNNDTDNKTYQLEKDEFKFGKDIVNAERLKDSSISFGDNVKVMFKSWGGFGYEDSVIANESFAAQYGLAVASMFKISDKAVTERDTDDKEIKCEYFSSNGTKTVGLDGLAARGSKLKPGQIAINKAVKGSKINKPTRLKIGQQGTVVNSFVLNGKKSKYREETIANVIVGSIDKLAQGDKVGGLHGNKGVIGKIVPAEDLPFCKFGTPDIILNPLGVISRTNIGQLIEALKAAQGETSGIVQVLEPFSDLTIEEMIKDAEKYGLEEVEVFDGRTGKRYERKAFMGNMYFLRSSHTSTSKHNVCGLTEAKRNSVSRQPIRANGGGQKISELLANALRAHNATTVLDSLFTTQSDDVESCKELISNIENGEPLKEVDGTYRNADLFLAMFRTLGVNLHKDAMNNGINRFVPLTDADVDVLSLNKIECKSLNIATKQSPLDAFLRDTSYLEKYNARGNMDELKRTVYSSIELPCKVIMPLVCYGDKFLNMFVINYEGSYKLMSMVTFKSFLNNKLVLVNKNFKGIAQVVTTKTAREESLKSDESAMGISALNAIFERTDMKYTVASVEMMIARICDRLEMANAISKAYVDPAELEADVYKGMQEMRLEASSDYAEDSKTVIGSVLSAGEKCDDFYNDELPESSSEDGLSTPTSSTNSKDSEELAAEKNAAEMGESDTNNSEDAVGVGNISETEKSIELIAGEEGLIEVVNAEVDEAELELESSENQLAESNEEESEESEIDPEAEEARIYEDLASVQDAISAIGDSMLKRSQVEKLGKSKMEDILWVPEKLAGSHTLERLLTIRGTTINFIENQDIEDYFVGHILIPPIEYRPDFEGRLASPIDKQLVGLISKIKTYNTNPNQYNLTNVYKELFYMVAISPTRKKSDKNIFEMIVSHANSNSKIRDTLFAKRILASGRSVITVNPTLKLGETMIPFSIAAETFKVLLLAERKTKFPMLNSKLSTESKSLADQNSTPLTKKDYENFFVTLANNNLLEFSELLSNVNRDYSKNNKSFMELNSIFMQCRRELKNVLNGYFDIYPVILNREPSLHKFNAMSFHGQVTESHAIELHPLACRPYNADFDGDQMADFVPFEKRAIEEAKSKLDQRNNLINPNNGKLIVELNQDMILGLYWLTMNKSNMERNDNPYVSKIYSVRADRALQTSVQKVERDLANGEIRNTDVVTYFLDGVKCISEADQVSYATRSDVLSQDHEDCFEIISSTPRHQPSRVIAKEYTDDSSLSVAELMNIFYDYKNVMLMEIWQDIEDGVIKPQDTIILKIENRLYRSTAGRIILNSLLPDGIGFTDEKDYSILKPDNKSEEVMEASKFYKLQFDKTISNKEIRELTAFLQDRYTLEVQNEIKLTDATEETDLFSESNNKFCQVLDRLKDTGFKMADLSGINISVFDFRELELTRKNSSIMKTVFTTADSIIKESRGIPEGGKENRTTEMKRLLKPLNVLIEDLTKPSKDNDKSLVITKIGLTKRIARNYSEVMQWLNDQLCTPHSIVFAKIDKEAGNQFINQMSSLVDATSSQDLQGVTMRFVDEVEVKAEAEVEVKAEAEVEVRSEAEVEVRSKWKVLTLAQAAISYVLPGMNIDSQVTSDDLVDFVEFLGGSTKLYKSLIDILTVLISKSGKSIETDIAGGYDHLNAEVGVNLMNHNIAIINRKFKEGRLTSDKRAELIQVITTKYKDTVTSDVTSALEVNRNSNLFIMVRSGARGNINQLMEVCGIIGTVSDGSGKPVSSPINSNLLNGLSPTDLFNYSLSARTILVDTQLDIPMSGTLNRELSYTTEYIKVRDERSHTVSDLTEKVESNEIFCGTESIDIPIHWDPIVPENVKKLYLGTKVSGGDPHWRSFREKYYATNPVHNISKETKEFIQDYCKHAEDGDEGYTKFDTIRILTNDRQIKKISVDELTVGMDMLINIPSPIVKEIRNEFANECIITPTIKELLAEEELKSIWVWGEKSQASKASDEKFLGNERDNSEVDDEGVVAEGDAANSKDKDEVQDLNVSLQKITYAMSSVSVSTVYYRCLDTTKLSDEVLQLARQFCYEKMDPDSPRSTVGLVITQKFLQAIQENELYVQSIPIYTIINCKCDHGICRRCYGMKYDTSMMPEPGELIGFQGVQAICSTLSQMILDTHKSSNGGAAKVEMKRINDIIDKQITFDNRLETDITAFLEGVNKDITSLMTSSEKDIYESVCRNLKYAALNYVLKDKYEVIDVLINKNAKPAGEECSSHREIPIALLRECYSLSQQYSKELPIAVNDEEMQEVIRSIVTLAQMKMGLANALSASNETFISDYRFGAFNLTEESKKVFVSRPTQEAQLVISGHSKDTILQNSKTEELREEVTLKLKDSLMETKKFLDTGNNAVDRVALEDNAIKAYLSIFEGALAEGTISEVTDLVVTECMQRCEEGTQYQPGNIFSLVITDRESSSGSQGFDDSLEIPRRLKEYILKHVSIQDKTVYMRLSVWFDLVDLMKEHSVLARNQELFPKALIDCGVCNTDKITKRRVYSQGCVYSITELDKNEVDYTPVKLSSKEALSHNNQIYADTFLKDTRNSIISHIVNQDDDVGSPIGQAITGYNPVIEVTPYDLQIVSAEKSKVVQDASNYERSVTLDTSSNSDYEWDDSDYDYEDTSRFSDISEDAAGTEVAKDDAQLTSRFSDEAEVESREARVKTEEARVETEEARTTSRFSEDEENTQSASEDEDVNKNESTLMKSEEDTKETSLFSEEY